MRFPAAAGSASPLIHEKKRRLRREDASSRFPVQEVNQLRLSPTPNNFHSRRLIPLILKSSFSMDEENCIDSSSAKKERISGLPP